MKPAPKIVISASRRTDIPAFYMDWFMDRIQKGCFEVLNPFNRKVSTVPATPETVHTIVFWSKNFDPFIQGSFGHKLRDCGYHLFFNFTVNSESMVLEPHVPPLDERLRQMAYLGRHFGAENINWRFDPICFFTTGKNRVQDNLRDLDRIAVFASDVGIQRCITSFRDDYAKIRKRVAQKPFFSFIDLPLEAKVDLLLEMEQGLSAKKIHLHTCCEPKILDMLPASSQIRKSSCIPNDFLVKRFGGSLSFRKDRGQRVQQGCGCMVSADIGSYDRHRCLHGCLYCYANPA